MRHTLRPHRVFLLHRTDRPADRLASFVLPTDRTPRLLETAILIALLRALGARKVLEIGTLYGLQTLNLAANLPADGHVWTLDLDEGALARAAHAPADRAIAEQHRAQAHAPAFGSLPWRERVTQLWGDSTAFDFTPLLGRMNLVYVDGGHDTRTVASDSGRAFSLLDPDWPGAIVWHDDQNPAHPDVGTHLDELARDRDVFHVAETWLAFHLNPAARLLQEALI